MMNTELPLPTRRGPLDQVTLDILLTNELALVAKNGWTQTEFLPANAETMRDLPALKAHIKQVLDDRTVKAGADVKQELEFVEADLLGGSPSTVAVQAEAGQISKVMVRIDCAWVFYLIPTFAAFASIGLVVNLGRGVEYDMGGIIGHVIVFSGLPISFYALLRKRMKAELEEQTRRWNRVVNRLNEMR